MQSELVAEVSQHFKGYQSAGEDAKPGRPRLQSIDATSERGELMSASFFDEEEQNCEMGQKKWEDFMAIQENERR